MTGQTSLDLRDDGAERAIQRDPEWATMVRLHIQVLPSGTTFTADVLTRWHGLPRGASKNAVGGLLISLQRAGLIEGTGKFVRSQRLARRGGWVQIWRRR